jgi:mannose-6-phosphate isomerase-like protein (cupin superfamily)
VLSGEMRLILGKHDITMQPGEVAEFDTTEPHWFGPADSHPVEILHLYGPRGDQATNRLT